MDGLIYVDEKIWTDAVKTMGEMIKNKKLLLKLILQPRKRG